MSTHRKVGLHRGTRVRHNGYELSFRFELVGGGHMVVHALLVNDRRLECREERYGSL